MNHTRNLIAAAALLIMTLLAPSASASYIDSSSIRIYHLGGAGTNAQVAVVFDGRCTTGILQFALGDGSSGQLDLTRVGVGCFGNLEDEFTGYEKGGGGAGLTTANVPFTWVIQQNYAYLRVDLLLHYQNSGSYEFAVSHPRYGGPLTASTEVRIDSSRTFFQYGVLVGDNSNDRTLGARGELGGYCHLMAGPYNSNDGFSPEGGSLGAIPCGTAWGTAYYPPANSCYLTYDGQPFWPAPYACGTIIVNLDDGNTLWVYQDQNDNGQIDANEGIGLPLGAYIDGVEPVMCGPAQNRNLHADGDCEGDDWQAPTASGLQQDIESLTTV